MSAALRSPDAGSGGVPPTGAPHGTATAPAGGRRHSRRPLMLAAAVAVALTAGIGVAASTLIGADDSTPAGDAPSTARVLDTSSVTPQGTTVPTTPTLSAVSAVPAPTTAATPVAPTVPSTGSADLLPLIIPTDAPSLPVDTGSAVVSSLAPGDPGFGWPTTDPETP